MAIEPKNFQQEYQSSECDISPVKVTVKYCFLSLGILLAVLRPSGSRAILNCSLSGTDIWSWKYADFVAASPAALMNVVQTASAGFGLHTGNTKINQQNGEWLRNMKFYEDKACSKNDRTFAIRTLFYNILSTVPFKVVPSTGDTPFSTFFHCWNASWNALSVMSRSSLIAFSWISTCSKKDRSF